MSGAGTLDDHDLNALTNVGDYRCGSCVLSQGDSVGTFNLAGNPISWEAASATLSMGATADTLRVALTDSPGGTSDVISMNLIYPAGTFPDDALPSAFPYPATSAIIERFSLFTAQGAVNGPGVLILTRPVSEVPEPTTLGPSKHRLAGDGRPWQRFSTGQAQTFQHSALTRGHAEFSI